MYHPMEEPDQRLLFRRLPRIEAPLPTLRPLTPRYLNGFSWYEALRRLQVCIAVFPGQLQSALLSLNRASSLHLTTCSTGPLVWLLRTAWHRDLAAQLRASIRPKACKLSSNAGTPSISIQVVTSTFRQLQQPVAKRNKALMWPHNITSISVAVQGDRLEALKITGDPNVPAGNFSIVVDGAAVKPGPYDGIEADAPGPMRPVGALDSQYQGFED